MDLAKLIERAKGICLSPKAEWPKIAAETADVKSLYVGYAMILAAIPALAKLLSTARFSLAMAIGIAALSYLLGLVAIFVVGLIINAFAPTFDATPEPTQSLKIAVYSATPGWIAGIFNVIPWVGWMLSVAGSLYGAYLLFEGLSPLMKSPPDKSLGYAVLVVVCSAVLLFIVSAVPGMLFLGGLAMAGAGLMR